MVHHDQFTPFLLNIKADKTHAEQNKSVYPQGDCHLIPKYVGNIVVKREHLKRILLDNKAQVYFDQMKKHILESNDFVNV